jgi:hypothetical protein
VYEPVCGNDQKTYFSPCFAGCTQTDATAVDRESIVGKVARTSVVCVVVWADWEHKHGVQNYMSCRCIANNFSQSTLGECKREGPNNCAMIAPFLILLFMLTFVASNNQMPLIMITLRYGGARVVRRHSRAFIGL